MYSTFAALPLVFAGRRLRGDYREPGGGDLPAVGVDVADVDGAVGPGDPAQHARPLGARQVLVAPLLEADELSKRVLPGLSSGVAGLYPQLA
jgi:hypothetical protein